MKKILLLASSILSLHCISQNDALRPMNAGESEFYKNTKSKLEKIVLPVKNHFLTNHWLLVLDNSALNEESELSILKSKPFDILPISFEFTISLQMDEENPELPSFIQETNKALEMAIQNPEHPEKALKNFNPRKNSINLRVMVNSQSPPTTSEGITYDFFNSFNPVAIDTSNKNYIALRSDKCANSTNYADACPAMALMFGKWIFSVKKGEVQPGSGILQYFTSATTAPVGNTNHCKVTSLAIEITADPAYRAQIMSKLDIGALKQLVNGM